MNTNNPQFMICDPLPSQVDQYPNEYVLDTFHGILWMFDHEGNGSVAEWLSQPIKDASILAQAAREAGEWLTQYRTEEDKINLN